MFRALSMVSSCLVSAASHNSSPFLVVEAALSNTNFITCPFLSSCVNERVLPVKQEYTVAELREVTMLAGLKMADADDHIEGNFKNNPSGVQDIFNMEGEPNEHDLSTGINDCKTIFQDCSGPEGNKRCITFTLRTCLLPNPRIFDKFWAAVDTNWDGVVTRAELDDPDLLVSLHSFPIGPPGPHRFPVVDVNPLGMGTIPGSYGFLMTIFGETENTISRERLHRICIDRRFPDGYTFPAAHHRRPAVQDIGHV